MSCSQRMHNDRRNFLGCSLCCNLHFSIHSHTTRLFYSQPTNSYSFLLSYAKAYTLIDTAYKILRPSTRTNIQQKCSKLGFQTLPKYYIKATYRPHKEIHSFKSL